MRQLTTNHSDEMQPETQRKKDIRSMQIWGRDLRQGKNLLGILEEA